LPSATEGFLFARERSSLLGLSREKEEIEKRTRNDD